MYEERTFECESCNQIYDSLYMPEIEYDGMFYCTLCFLKELRRDCDELRKTGHMLKIEAYSTGIEAPVLTDEEYISCITVL